MSNFARIVRAVGRGLQEFAGALDRPEERSLGTDEQFDAYQEAFDRGQDNPHVGEDVADWLFDNLDHLIMALWPTALVSANQAFTVARLSLSAYVESAGGPDLSATSLVRGAVWEIARLSAACLADDTDATQMWASEGVCTFWAVMPDTGEQKDLNLSAESTAFFDAALRGDQEAAFHVFTAVVRRAAEWSRGNVPLAALATQAFLSILLVNLAGTYGQQTHPEVTA